MTTGELIGYVILALVAAWTLRKALVEVAVAVLGPKIAQRRAEAAQSARLVADADYEHWHALFGDEDVATHGRFPPHEGTKHP